MQWQVLGIDIWHKNIFVDIFVHQPTTTLQKECVTCIIQRLFHWISAIFWQSIWIVKCFSGQNPLNFWKVAKYSHKQAKTIGSRMGKLRWQKKSINALLMVSVLINKDIASHYTDVLWARIELLVSRNPRNGLIGCSSCKINLIFGNCVSSCPTRRLNFIPLSSHMWCLYM